MADGAHIDELLGNAAWVRRLAQRMLADRELAEDVAQETWIAGLRSGPRGSELRPWLARVVRNFALQKLRAERARTSRERATARPEPLPSSADTVERAELHARLVQAVLALDEPYRTTILWRYFEELDDVEIARRAGIDVATVRSRVARARAKLRDALTRRGGGPPEHWLAALVPLDALTRLAPSAGTGASTSTSTSTGAGAGASTSATVIGGTGAIVMSLKVVGATAAAVILAAALWWAWPAERGAVGDPTAPVAVLDATAPDVVDPGELAAAPDPGDRSAAAVAAASASSTTSAPIALLRGVVLDEDGRVPLAAARVSHRKGSESSRSGLPAVTLATVAATDTQGRFEIEAPREADVGLWFERDGYFPLKISAADLPSDTERPLEVVLAPLGRIELLLLDENGAAVADAPIAYSIDVGRGSQDQRWAHRGHVRSGSTGPDGRLSIHALPCGMPISLRGARTSDDDWLGSVTIDVRARVLDYEARLPSKPKLRGRIVRAGRALEEPVDVTWQPFPLGYRDAVTAQSGADGRFELAGLRPGKAEVRFGPPGTPPRVVSLKPGETLDLGDLAISDVVALGGRLVSSFGVVDDALFVRAFRGGRQLVEMRVKDAAFRGLVTPGELELIVARGGWWSEGNITPHRILARVVLLEPAVGVDISLDDGRGGIEFALAGPANGREPGRTVQWSVFAPEGGSTALGGGTAMVQADGRVRIGPVVPGRYRARLAIEGIGAVFSDEIAVTASAITDGGELSLAKTALVARVIDPAGRPVSRATLKVLGPPPEVEGRTGEDGRVRLEGLAPGYVGVRISHAELGRLVRENVLVAAGEETENVFVLGGFAVIEGTLTSGSLPVPATSVHVQPQGSNDMFNASTDAHGRFRVDGLPSGSLRVWILGRVMTNVDVAPGETRRLDLALGAPRVVRFVRDGAVVDGLFSVAAIANDAASLAAGRWTMGEVDDTTADLEIPSGPTLFCVACAATGSQYSFVALGSGAEETVTMPSGSVTIATSGAWHGPLPRAQLVDLDGHAVLGMWGRAIELALELDADGRARVPCVPPRARIELHGFDSRGESVVIEATTGADGRGTVRWP